MFRRHYFTLLSPLLSPTSSLLFDPCAALLIVLGLWIPIRLHAQVLTDLTQSSAIALNPVTNKIYYSLVEPHRVVYASNQVDGATNEVINNLGCGMCAAIAVNPVTNKIYVTENSGNFVVVIDAATVNVVNVYPTEVNTGTNPGAIALNPLTNQIYVANYSSGTVTVINGATNQTTTVTVGTQPFAVAVNPVTDQIYVTNNGSNTVTVIDGATNQTTTVSVENKPQGVAVNPVTNKIYVANSSSYHVTVIDGATNQTTTVDTGGNPVALAVDPVRNQIYVSDSGFSTPKTGNDLVVIDGATNICTTLSHGDAGGAVAVNPVTNRVYAVNIYTPYTDSALTIVDGATNVVTVGTDSTPSAAAVNTVTNQIYVANATSGTVTVIDGVTNNTTNVTTGAGPDAVEANPLTNQIYVANELSNNVTVIDGATNVPTATVSVGNLPVAVAVNPLTNKIYVVNKGSCSWSTSTCIYNQDSSVTVIDGATNGTQAVSTGLYPVAVAVNLITNQIYVVNSGSNNVTVINGANNSTTTVAAGTRPVAVAVNQVTNKIYVANYGSNNNGSDTVTVIDGASNQTATVSVGVSYQPVAVNSLTNQIYVSTPGSNCNCVTLIDGATNQTTSLVPTISVPMDPGAMAFNSLTNEIYVIDTSNIGYGGLLWLIDAHLNPSNHHIAGTVSYLSTPTKPADVAPAVNPLTNRTYFAGSDNSVQVITTGVQSNPMSVQVQGVDDAQTVSGLAVFATSNVNPSFTASVTSSYAPTAPTPTAVYYQVDTATEGQQATATTSTGANSASYNFSLSNVPWGLHTVYVFAVYGGEGTTETSGAGSGNSPEISNVTAFQFAILPVPTTTAVTADVNPQNAGSNVTFTAWVAPVSGTGSPTGTVTFFDGSAQLAAVSLDSSGHATYATSALSAGAHTITASYSGDATFNGSTTTVLTETINASAAQSITFTVSPSTVAYGISPIALVATASSGLPVTFTVVSGPGSVSGNTLTVTGTGSIVIQADQPGNSSYAAATPVRQTLTVNQAPAITSANGATFLLGAAGSFTVTASGFPAPTFSTASPLPSGVAFIDNHNGTASLGGTPASGTGGTYFITITASNGISPDATQNFTLTVNEAPTISGPRSLTCTVPTPCSAAVSTTGFPNPTLSETGALPNGVTLTDNHNGTGTLGGTPTAGSGGVYNSVTINATNAAGSAPALPILVTVNEPPTITSGIRATFAVGTAGTFTVTATGFPAPTFSETGALPSSVTLTASGVLSGTPAAGTAGIYPITITASNGVSPNLTQGFMLTVNQVPAINSVSNVTFKVGTGGTFTVTATGFPAPTFSETGALPNGVTLDASGILHGTPASGTGGTYLITITASNGALPNATQNFTLTVVETLLTVTANNATRQYGQANPALTGTIVGLQDGDNITATYSTTATPTSNVGSYAITPTLVDPGGKLANYTVTMNNGTLTVTPAPLTVTADNKMKVYGAPLPAFTVSYSGLVNGDTSGVLSGPPACSTNATAMSLVGNHSIVCLGQTSTNYTIGYVQGQLSIIQDSTGTTITATTPTILGQPVTLTAAVTAAAPGSGTPTGTVTFKDGTASLGTGLLGSGQASLTTSTLSVGSHAITAQYGGDADFMASSGSFTQQVKDNICALYDQTKSVKSGADAPIKLYLCDVKGNDVSSPSIVLHATQVVGISGYSGAPESPGNSNPDADFVFDSTLGTTGGYHFNLKTTGLASGTYSLQFVVTNDPVTHSVNFGVN